MKALIKDNQVVHLSENDFPVHSSMKWMDAPQNCKNGWVLIDDVLQEKPEPQKTRQQLKSLYAEKLQQHIDNKAKEKSYRDGYACATYINSTDLNWRNEAKAFIAWRDRLWLYANNILNKTSDGSPIPSIKDFINDAPTIQW